MNKPIVLSMLGVLVMLTAPFASLADENIGEKVNTEANTAGRKMKKGAHRAQEKACKAGTANCAGKKMKHRASEAGDAVSDKAEELKDKVD